MLYSRYLDSEHIDRIRIPENRDLINGLRCNRNERVEYWDENYIKELYKDLNIFDFTLYPDLSIIYSKISSYENIDPSNLLIGSGIDGLIKNIYETYTKQKMNIGLLSPSYAMYYVYSKIYNCNLVEIGYDFKSFKLNKDFLFDKLKEIELLFIPNPNQPIEDNLSLSFCENLAKKCQENNVLLIFDEAYYGFGSETAKDLIYNYDNVGVMRTFSKYFGMPSLRIGYLMANSKLIKKISQKRVSYETNSICQKIAINLLKNINFIKKYNDEVCLSRDELKEFFNQKNIRVNVDKSNFILLDLENNELKNKISYDLINNKIYTKDNFKNDLENCILMTIGPKKLMNKVKDIFN